MAESETSQKRQDLTGPRANGGSAHGLIERVRVALGGRDHGAEVDGYRLALKGAGTTQVNLIVDRLLELAQTDVAVAALSAIAGVFNRLDGAKRESALVAGHGLWGRAIGGPAIDVDPSVRLSASVLIGRACEAESFGWLRGLLGDQDKAVAEAAGASLMTLARRAAAVPALDGETRGAVERLVIRCVREFDTHRRREALGALLVMCPGAAALRGANVELKEWLADEEHPAHMAMRGLIRRGEIAGVHIREAAWAWMGNAAYRTACAERVLAPSPPAVRDLAAEWSGVLSQGHLLLSPVRESGLRAMAERLPRGQAGAHGLPIGEDDIARLPAAAQARLAAWAGCMAEEELGAALEPLLGVESTRARLNALRAVGAPMGEGAAELALDFCFDANGRVAQAGLLRAVVGARASGDAGLSAGVRGAVVALRRSEHERPRRAADAFGAMFDALDETMGRLEARRMLRGNRAGLVRALQTMVRTGTGAERVRAIRLAGRLGLGAELELELLAVIGASVGAEAAVDGRGTVYAASAAVVVLAELKSPAAQHALHKCLRHPDDRVRANALDAMARAARRGGWIGSTDSPLGKAVVEFGDDPHHRVRAGAARARAMAAGRGQGGGVGPIVVPLLRDERAMHRVSGLWLAERVAGDGEVARTIAEMVRSDPSPEVRVRARRTAGRMLAGMGR